MHEPPFTLRPAMPAVLVLEDDEAYRTLIADVLTLAGFEVCTAPDGRRVAKILQDRVIDLIITDLVMPGCDGWETMRSLRASHPGLPVIAISGDVSLDRELHFTTAKRLGAARVLAKPFKMSRLVNAARQALEASETALVAAAG